MAARVTPSSRPSADHMGPSQPSQRSSQTQVARGAAHDDDEAMTDAAEDTDATATKPRHILLSVDWGTALLSASYAICDDGGTVVEGDLDNIRFGDSTYEAPMVIALIDGVLTWGCELQERILAGKVDDEDVIDLLKLELYDNPDPNREERCKLIRQQLTKLGVSVTDLIGRHLEVVVKDCLTEIYRSEDKIFQVKLRDLPYRLRLSVPQMWSPKACQDMQDAAKAAGLEFVTLASEPASALAYLVNKISRKHARLGGILKKYDNILVVDLGGGTGDLVTYTLKDELSEDSRLDAVSSTAGARCGSQEVSEEILSRLEKGKSVREEGGLKAIRNRLSLTEIQWRKRALREIERIKCGFTGVQKRNMGTVTATGENSAFFTFDIPQKDMQESFDLVVAEIIHEMDAELANVTPRVIYITGGFTRNTYLMQKLRGRYDGGGIDVNLPSQYGYAIIQDELYDWRLHEDAVLEVTQANRWVGKKGKRSLVMCDIHHPDPAIVFESLHDPEKDVVLDRLQVLFEKKTIIANDQVIGHNIYQEYFLLAAEPKLSATLVYFDNSLKTHDPSGKSKDHPPTFKNGIQHLRTVTKEVDAAFLNNHGVLITHDSKGRAEYKVLCRVTVRYKGGQDMKIRWQMRIPKQVTDGGGEGGDEKKATGSGKPKVEYEEVQLWEDDETVWDAKHSPFVEERPPVEESEDAMDVDG
ncbi:hypothetical protein LTR85_006786 [Meristemomyces frigidus]|nr:hypothetical protein LTR85_006786 [Meristemomyces frigidus]